MKRIIFLILAVAFASGAQSSPSPTAPSWISESLKEAWTLGPPNQDPVKLPAVSPGQTALQRPAVQVKHRKTLDRKFWAVAAMVIGSSVFDIESSQRCLQTGKCREGNPLMSSRRGPQYAIKMSLSAGMIVFTYFLKKDDDSFHTSNEKEGIKYGSTWWWLPAVGPTAVFTGAGTYNMIRFRNTKPESKLMGKQKD